MPDDIIAKEEKKDINDFEGLDGDDLHDAMMAQAEEEIQAEKEGREPKRVLDKQDESSDSKDDDGKSQDSEEQGDDDQGKDDDANEDKDADKDDDSEDDDSDDDSEGDDDEKGDEGDLDKEISEHAEKEGMSYADAKEDLEKTKRIVEQYGDDKYKMAKAMRDKDREYQKLRVEKEKAEKKEPMFQKKSDAQFLKEATHLLSNPPESEMGDDGSHIAVTNYRKQWPARSESMSDEAVIEQIAADALVGYRDIAEKEEKKVEATADQKRDDFITGLPKDDKRFIPEIKAILSKTDKFTLAQEDFDFKDIVDLIKGRSYDADIKAAYERGTKKGSEKPNIAGVRSANGGSNNGRGKDSASAPLNEKQKKRALEMFDANYEEKECYQMYIDTFGDRIKKDPKFV